MPAQYLRTEHHLLPSFLAIRDPAGQANVAAAMKITMHWHGTVPATRLRQLI